jgi:hypothetical protein
VTMTPSMVAITRVEGAPVSKGESRGRSRFNFTGRRGGTGDDAAAQDDGGGGTWPEMTMASGGGRRGMGPGGPKGH